MGIKNGGVKGRRKKRKLKGGDKGKGEGKKGRGGGEMDENKINDNG
jgi:hypothetical protein